VVDLSEDVAATSGALAMVVLELVATGLGASAMAGPALHRAAVRHLLPLVGQAAGLAAGFPEVLRAALSLRPAHSPGARLARLVGLAAGSLIEPPASEEHSPPESAPGVKTALAAARKAAERTTRAKGEQR